MISVTSSSRVLEHVGELKVELEADTLGELFAELARVIADAIGPHVVRESADWERVELTARDAPTLLVDWANELIGRSEVAGLAYWKTHILEIVQGPPARLAADVLGGAVDEWVSPIKAATYHGAVVERPKDKDHWRAVVLLDV